ncbi:MAG: GCN5-related N-acetyltransferase [Akkermansiaceae bacterium]|nr:GCN5-related N-acetyltransferase [Akkermansiaceae bacterium]
MIPGFPDPPVGLAEEEVTLVFSQMLPGNPGLGFVPSYHFRIRANDECTGHINLRIGETEHVRLCAGHIGYEIEPRFRGRSLALKACRALAPFVRRFVPEAIITCDPDNWPSRVTIERLGARFLNELPVPATDPHYLRGSRTKRRYLWRP